MSEEKKVLSFKTTEYFNSEGFDIVFYECLEDTTKSKWGLKVPIMTQHGLQPGIIELKEATTVEHAFAKAEFAMRDHAEKMKKEINKAKLIQGTADDLRTLEGINPIKKLVT